MADVKVSPHLSHPSHVGKPAHWRVDVGSEAVATLVIPAALTRSRTFDMDVSLLVNVPLEFVEPWHELSVEIDGLRQWQRRIPSSSPGQTDGLDYHCRITLEAGRALRIRATTARAGSSIKQLCIEAREDL